MALSPDSERNSFLALCRRSHIDLQGSGYRTALQAVATPGPWRSRELHKLHHDELELGLSQRDEAEADARFADSAAHGGDFVGDLVTGGAQRSLNECYASAREGHLAQAGMELAGGAGRVLASTVVTGATETLRLGGEAVEALRASSLGQRAAAGAGGTCRAVASWAEGLFHSRAAAAVLPANNVRQVDAARRSSAVPRPDAHRQPENGQAHRLQ